MNEKTSRISASQLFCLLFLCRMSVEATFPRTVSQTAFEAVAGMVMSELTRFLAALPVIVYSARGNDLYKSISSKSRVLGRFAAAIAAVLLIYASVRSLLELSRFAGRELLIDGAVPVLFAAAVIFAVYAATRGAEALARSGAVFLMLAAVITLAVAVSVTPYIKPASFEALRKTGDTPRIISDFIERLSRGGEYLVFAVMLPYVSEKSTGSLWKTAVIFAGASAAAAAAMCFMNCLVLREFYGQCDNPLTSVASLGDISLLKRLDGFAAAIWGLCAAYRGAVMLAAAIFLLYRPQVKVEREGGKA